jgi:hypothetical protein
MLCAVKHMLKLSCSFNSVRFVLLKTWTEWVINCYILSNFSIPNHISLSEPEQSEREPHRITAPDPAPTIWCGSCSWTLFKFHAFKKNSAPWILCRYIECKGHLSRDFLPLVFLHQTISPRPLVHGLKCFKNTTNSQSYSTKSVNSCVNDTAVAKIGDFIVKYLWISKPLKKKRFNLYNGQCCGAARSRIFWSELEP